MKQPRRLCAVLSGLTVTVVLAQAILADVLVTKSGSRYKGKVTEKDGSYVLIRPGGGKITLSKSMVKEVIRSKQFKTRYKTMLKTADLTDDAQVDKLVQFIDEVGLVKERRKLLADTCDLRLAGAKGKLKALLALTAWCRKYGLKNEARDCRLRASRLEYQSKRAKTGNDPNRLRELAQWCQDRDLKDEAEECRLCANKSEFRTRFAAAGDDSNRLENLAKWCRQRNMSAEAARCLATRYERRKKQAETPGAKWRLAEWCHKWKLIKWRDENQLAAISGAASEKNLPLVKDFFDLLVNMNHSPRVKLACIRAMYKLRLQAAAKDAMALTKLMIWCQDHDLKTEAAKAEAAALKIAPNDANVRKALDYTWHEIKGKWVRMVFMADKAQLRESERVVRLRAQALVSDLREEHSNTQDRARKDLMRLRPLPAITVNLLIRCLSNSHKSTREGAAIVLAYHQRDAGKVLRKLQAARKSERSPEVRRQLDRSIKHLQAIGENLPVLADSARFTQLVRKAIIRLSKTPGRRFFVMTMPSDGGTLKSIEPLYNNLPDTITISTGTRKCRATIGWEWKVEYKNGITTVSPAPIGAIVRLEARLKLDKSVIPGGTILMHGTSGWSVLTEKQAIARMKAFLQLKQALAGCFMDYRQIGALGAATIGPAAGDLVKVLAETAGSNRHNRITVCCARAFERIGDKAALPILKKMRKHAMNYSDILNSIDSVITTLEK